MKNFIINIYSLINKILLLIYLRKVELRGSSFFQVRISKTQDFIQILSSKLEKSIISLSGENNSLISYNSFISKCNITIKGSNNKLIIREGVKLRSAIIIIRGNNCIVEIGKNTTFGGIRIVNVGENNSIHIGENCLFSDNIELWASDTHPIFNLANEIINTERPILIKNNVWIGSRVTILKGVTINDGSVIGMGSLVNKDVPKNVISAGFPSKTIKEGISWRL